MELLRKFIKEEDGLGTIEIVLIAVILVGLVITFKGAIKTALTTITDKFTKDVNDALK